MFWTVTLLQVLVNACRVFLVSVLFSGGTTSFVSGLSFIELSVAEVGDSISVSENEVCLYDSLSIGWKELCSDCYIGIWTDNVDSTVALIDGCSNVLSQSSAEGPRHDLCSSIDNNDIISESDSVPERPYLRCGLNEDHCVPVVDSISIENNELVLEFSDIQQLRYTEVDVNSTAALSAIFSFVPSLQPKPDHKNKNKNKEFGAITGRWSDRNETNKLTLTVSSEDGSHLPFIQAVYGAHASGSPISITPLLPPSHSRYNSSDPLTRRDFASARIAQCACSSVSTRMMQYGDFSVGVVDTLSKHVTSRVHRVTVSACLGDVLVWANEGSSGSVSSSDPALRVVVTHGQGHGGASLTEDAAPPLSLNAINGAPTPAVHWNGVLSLVGKSSMFQIPHDVTHGMITGSWSLSFHILLLTGPTGAMRTVFYKGDYSGRDPNRTPSVWLMPNSNKLSIRVSSNVSTDVGVETISPLSSQQWTHVTFTFKNNTYEYQQRLEQFARKYDIPLGPVMPNGTSPSQGEADINSTANTCDENSEFRGNNTTIVGNCSDKELSYRDLNQTVGDNDGNGAVSETEVSATKDRDIFSLWRDHADFPRAPAAAATMHVYIDGKLDISVSYKDPLIGNNHALYMFKDISHAGPVGFVQDLAVFEGELSAVEVTSLYRSGFEKERKRKRPPRKGREPRPAGAARVARGAVQNGVAFMRHSEWFRQHGLGNIDSECDPDPDPDGDIDGETPPVHSFRRQDDEAAGSLLKEMQDAHAASCQYSPSERREFFADLVETWSHAPSLYLYGMMEGFGTEGPQNQCGLGGGGDNEQYVSDRDDVAVINRTGDGNDGGILTVRAGSPALSPLKALLSLLVALEFGIDAALVPLSTMLLSGVGVSEWLELLSMFPDLHAPGISRTNSTIGNSDGEFETYHEVLLSLVPLSDDMAAWLRQGAINERGRGTKGSLLIQMHWILVALLQPSAEEAPANGDFRGLPIATSALCWRYNCPAVDVQTVGGVVEGDTDGVTSIALGLLHLGAMVDDHEAQRILSHRYKHGLTVPPSVEVSAQYGLIAATIALDEFHKIGLTPIVEKDRIDETTDDKIDQGNTGNDDALIQAQIMRAEGGDVPALMATGDLYYYGARGLPRDQPRALDYFTRAETLGSTEAKCAMANMYLKGEGTVPANSKNVTLAIELYEEAAALGSVRGLNGLGYIYFYGQEVPKNESKAFGYFLAAAETGTDQDSLFNTAHCLEHGVGTSKDVERAVSFYTTAAQKFGNFGSVKALGVLYLHGSGVARSPSTALNYLTAAGFSGPWGMWIRRGLDNYLVGDYRRALLCYTHGGELGYEVSVANSAYILQKKLIFSGGGGALHAMRQLAVASTASLPADIFSIDVSFNESVLPAADPSSRHLDHMNYHGALYIRELVLSSSYDNTDSIVKLGHIFIDGLNKLNIHQWGGYHYTGESNAKAAIYWYSRSAVAHHALSNLYLGALYQFHCVAAGNFESLTLKSMNSKSEVSCDISGSMARARMYYKAALNNPTLPGGFQLITHGLLWLTDNLLELKLSERSSTTSWTVPRENMRLNSNSNGNSDSQTCTSTTTAATTATEKSDNGHSGDGYWLKFLSACHNLLRVLYLWYSMYL